MDVCDCALCVVYSGSDDDDDDDDDVTAVEQNSSAADDGLYSTVIRTSQTVTLN